ncbi:monocyte differentiation antigen CD14 [Notamacropus eugenii]|uniref:Monocyte differentiation antigen CD14 n=1 Tax=Notamacropus eugenii TaxID=9315 RepID=B2X875_NOTEU|nr:CD14 [Notamacropus eugenii]
MEPWQRLLLLLLSPLLWLPSSSSAFCTLDEEGDNCFCNFSAPEPKWNDIAMCISAVEVEILGGSHNLETFLQKDFAVSSKAVDFLKALRLKRLKLKEALIPAPLLYQFLRALTYTRMKELALEDLVISHPPLQPRSPIDNDLPLTALNLNRVSLAGESNLLAAIGPWLKPGLKALRLTGLGLGNVPCPDLGTFKELNFLDLSDNPEIGESGLTRALCLKELQELQDLVLRNTSLQSLGKVCLGLEATGTNVQRLDISYNELKDMPTTQCTWPPTLISLNLSHAQLKCVPKPLPTNLRQLDLSYNLLRKKPIFNELPQETEVILEGNPFANSSVSAKLQGKQKPLDCDVSSRGSKSGGTPLALQVSGTAALALLRGVRGFS